MTPTSRIALLATFAIAVATAPVRGQAPAPVARDTAPMLAVGMTAPDFELRGATRYGLLATPVRLSDMRGETVVIAFFYKARTKG